MKNYWENAISWVVYRVGTLTTDALLFLAILGSMTIALTVKTSSRIGNVFPDFDPLVVAGVDVCWQLTDVER